MAYRISKQDHKRFIIARALNELLKTKAIDRITVIDLCTAADISRSTFYSYFDDIYQVGEWVWDNEPRLVLESLGEAFGYRACFQHLCDHLKALREQLGHIRPVREQNGDTYAQRNTFAILESRVVKTRGRPLDEIERMQLTYVSRANEALFLKWFEDDLAMPSSLLVDIIVRLAPDFVLEAVGE